MSGRSTSTKREPKKPPGPKTNADCPSVTIQVPVHLIHCDRWDNGFLSMGLAGGDITNPKTKKKLGDFSIPLGMGGVSVNTEGMTLQVRGKDLIDAIFQFMNDHPEQVEAMKAKFQGVINK